MFKIMKKKFKLQFSIKRNNSDKKKMTTFLDKKNVRII